MISHCCLSSSMKNIFLQLESIDEKDNVKIIAYKTTLYALYKKYKMQKCSSYFLAHRCLCLPYILFTFTLCCALRILSSFTLYKSS